MQMQQAALTLVALLKIYIIAESQARGTAFEPPSPWPECVQWKWQWKGVAGRAGENFNEKRPALCTINDFS